MQNNAKIIHLIDDIGQNEDIADILMPIKVFDDALDEVLLTDLQKHIHDVGFQFGNWKSNTDIDLPHWNRYFAGADKANRECVEDELTGVVRDAAFQMRDRFLPPNSKIIRCYSNAHTYGIDGFSHYDSLTETDKTVVLYVNKVWKFEWAGETTFFDEDGDIMRAVMPKPNRVVIFPGNILHAGRGVTRPCNVARTVFVIKARTD